MIANRRHHPARDGFAQSAAIRDAVVTASAAIHRRPKSAPSKWSTGNIINLDGLPAPRVAPPWASTILERWWV
jgi:hypothetical protein